MTPRAMRSLLVVTTATLAACGCSSKSDGSSSGGSAGTGSAEPAPAAMPARPIPAAQLAADLAMMPVDAELVVGLNLAELVPSPAWATLVQPLLADNAVTGKIGELKARCGLDPFATITAATVGIKSLAGASPEGVIVIHGLPKSKTLACLATAKPAAGSGSGSGSGSASDGELVVTSVGAVTTVVTPRGDKLAFEFVSDNDVVLVFGPSADPAAVATAKVGGGKMRDSSELTPVFEAMGPTRSAWLVLKGTAKPFDTVAKLTKRPRGLAATASSLDGLAIETVLLMEDADAATRFAALVQSQVETLPSLIPIERVSVTAEGNNVKLVARAVGSKLAELSQRLRSLTGGRFGPRGPVNP